MMIQEKLYKSYEKNCGVNNYDFVAFLVNGLLKLNSAPVM